MLIIHGRTNSSNVQKVLWAVTEMNVPHDRRDAGGAFGVVNEPHYLAMNPNAKVPTIDDDGFILWESNAILRYLAAKHDNGTLFPVEPQQRADADRWMDWQQTTVGPTLTPIFWGLVRTPEAERDPAAIEAARVAMIPVMQMLDDRLADRTHVAGDAFTLADIPLGIMAYRWLSLITDRPAMRHLERWYDGLTRRTAFRQRVLDIPLT